MWSNLLNVSMDTKPHKPKYMGLLSVPTAKDLVLLHHEITPVHSIAF